MKHLKLGVPIEFVCGKIEETGIGDCAGKEDLVESIVEYILNSAYQSKKEANELFWSPSNAPEGVRCIVLVVGEFLVDLLVATKYESWVSNETQEPINGKVVAYMPVEITGETTKRAKRAFCGIKHNPETTKRKDES